MPGLPAVGELSYNGYTFDGTSKIKVESVPVRDEADRTVIFKRITISVEAVVAVPGSTTDATLENIHLRLSHDGAALVFKNKGFDRNLSVNIGRVKDLKCGPKVEVLSWEPIGSSQSCLIHWRVVVHVSACGKNGRQDGIIALNYDCSFAISERGATTRTISGYIEIAQTRTKAMRLTDSADDYRERFQLFLPKGFKRSQQWTVDKAKCRCDFTITDTEINSPVPYPAGVINISGTHKVSWSLREPRRRANISLQVERAAGIPGPQCYLMFLALIASRTEAARRANRNVMIERLDVEEEIFGYGANFSAGLLYTAGIDNFISEGGLWQPLGTDWETWRQSVAPSMFARRGTAGMGLSASDEFIVDLCGPDPRAPVGGGEVKEDQQGYSPGLLIKNQQPPASQSWTILEMRVIPTRQTPTAVQGILQAPSQEKGKPLAEQDSGSLSFPKTNGTPHVIQQSGLPKYSVYFVGKAERVGYEIPRPALTRVGSQPVVEVDAAWNHWCKGDALGVPVFCAEWAIEYQVASSPGTMQAPARFGEGKK